MQSNKLNAKDLIHVGIYTAIYLVIFFAIGLLGAVPILYPLEYLLIPFVTGIPFMLFLTKVEKFGMVSIMGVIIAVFWYLMGYTWIPTLTWIASGILSDLIFRLGKYKSFKLDVIGYWIFSCGMIGCAAPMWLLTSSYMKQVRDSMGDEYVAGLSKYMPSWMGFAAIGIILVSSILGALLGRKMLKKHFERAGIA
nr:MptD family putative ECF transporter S component [Shuttleworthia satelles]